MEFIKNGVLACRVARRFVEFGAYEVATLGIRFNPQGALNDSSI